ncbi:MAG TPA: hypothetical protein VFB25_08155 [Gaiellaceae bacterium]|nr:hypothetical protein [Gaiellaceae bacterium]
MAAKDGERAGVLIIRLWVEPGAEGQLRARLTQSRDLASRDQTTHAAGSVDEIVDHVRAWAEDFSEAR